MKEENIRSVLEEERLTKQQRKKMKADKVIWGGIGSQTTREESNL